MKLELLCPGLVFKVAPVDRRSVVLTRYHPVKKFSRALIAEFQRVLTGYH